jgi:hypothetical protein
MKHAVAISVSDHQVQIVERLVTSAIQGAKRTTASTISQMQEPQGSARSGG